MKKKKRWLVFSQIMDQYGDMRDSSNQQLLLGQLFEGYQTKWGKNNQLYRVVGFHGKKALIASVPTHHEHDSKGNCIAQSYDPQEKLHWYRCRVTRLPTKSPTSYRHFINKGHDGRFYFNYDKTNFAVYDPDNPIDVDKWFYYSEFSCMTIVG